VRSDEERVLEQDEGRAFAGRSVPLRGSIEGGGRRGREGRRDGRDDGGPGEAVNRGPGRREGGALAAGGLAVAAGLRRRDEGAALPGARSSAGQQEAGRRRPSSRQRSIICPGR